LLPVMRRALLFTLLLASASPAQQSAEALFAEGVRYTQSGDHAKARSAFLKALDLAPDSVPILNNLGVNALHRRDEPAAEGYFRRSLALAPNDGDALFNLGLIELKHKSFAEAALHLRRAAAVRPSDLDLCQALLGAELELGDKTRVDEVLARMLALAP